MRHKRPRAGRRTIRALVVDDSAVVRQALTGLLSREGDIEVAVAADPIIAMQKMPRVRPHVIVLDLEMPRMDGLTFLRKLMDEQRIPVVICSEAAGPGTHVALQALSEGAVAIVTKPRIGMGELPSDSAVMLIDAVRGAAEARLEAVGAAAEPLSHPAPIPSPRRPALQAPAGRTKADVVVSIGASTGGTEALREILQALPADAPGMVIVQHMPEVFTSAFALHLAQICAIEVREARDGDAVLVGRALIAPGGRHTGLVRQGLGYAVEVRDGPLVCRHRPSVDYLFRSTARAAGPNAVGVIMTGMGADGAEGLLEMRRAGAHTIAQDEESCVVFGMPKEAIACGAVREVLSLEDLAPAIVRRAACAPAGAPKAGKGDGGRPGS